MSRFILTLSGTTFSSRRAQIEELQSQQFRATEEASKPLESMSSRYCWSDRHSLIEDVINLEAKDAGKGAFGYIDFATNRFEHIAFCPGFARGLAFAGDYALIGLSQSRHDPLIDGLPLKQTLIDHNLPIRRGLMVMNLETGKLDHWMWMDDPISEIFDALVLPGIRCPMVSSLMVNCFPSAAPTGE